MFTFMQEKNIYISEKIFPCLKKYIISNFPESKWNKHEELIYTVVFFLALFNMVLCMPLKVNTKVKQYKG